MKCDLLPMGLFVFFFTPAWKFFQGRGTRGGRGEGRNVLGSAQRATCGDVEQVNSPSGSWGSASTWFTLKDGCPTSLNCSQAPPRGQFSFCPVLGTYFPFTCLQALFFQGQRNGKITEYKGAIALLQLHSLPHRAHLCGSLHHYPGVKRHTQSTRFI